MKPARPWRLAFLLLGLLTGLRGEENSAPAEIADDTEAVLPEQYNPGGMSEADREVVLLDGPIQADAADTERKSSEAIGPPPSLHAAPAMVDVRESEDESLAPPAREHSVEQDTLLALRKLAAQRDRYAARVQELSHERNFMAMLAGLLPIYLLFQLLLMVRAARVGKPVKDLSSGSRPGIKSGSRITFVRDETPQHGHPIDARHRA